MLCALVAIGKSPKVNIHKGTDVLFEINPIDPPDCNVRLKMHMPIIYNQNTEYLGLFLAAFGD